MAKRPELLIATGPMKGTRFQVGAGGVRLGRSSSNDVHIPDEEMSRNHCLLEQSGEDGIRVTDLASANGTFVNGEQLGSDPRELKVGDTLDIGATSIAVVNEGGSMPAVAPTVPVLPKVQAGGAVDLGLGGAGEKSVPAKRGASASSGGNASGQRRSPLANILWAVAVLVVAAAIAVVMYTPRGSEKPTVAPVVDEKPEQQLVSLAYEKVEADSARIFRYQMAIDSAGELRVAYDDVPGENRHVDKKTKLSPAALKRIYEILDTSGFPSLEDVYSGSSVADENSLRSYRIRVVRWNSVRDVLVENTPEPEPFRQVREALEAFSRNELGIWAIQYSREKLIELSKESEAAGDAKWEEREVEYGNLGAAVKAYREAVFYLETINPKPEGYALLKDKQRRTDEELKRRYEDQRFLADKAINLGDWEAALTELRILCSMVPDKDDPRHAEANARLVDVENRMKKERAK